jgi:hypothetical protein
MRWHLSVLFRTAGTRVPVTVTSAEMAQRLTSLRGQGSKDRRRQQRARSPVCSIGNILLINVNTIILGLLLLLFIKFELSSYEQPPRHSYPFLHSHSLFPYLGPNAKSNTLCFLSGCLSVAVPANCVLCFYHRRILYFKVFYVHEYDWE